MKVFRNVVLGVLAAVVVLAAGAAALLWRGDIPYATLEERYAVATSKYVDLPGGVRAHYRDDGPREAPVVVLVHGFGDSFLSWAPWIDILARDYRVITVDVPGHGLTRTPPGYAPSADAQVAYMEDFAAATQLPPFAIAGNSMGGSIAWRMTLAHPERVRALILIDAGGFMPPPSNEPPPLAFRLIGSPVGQWWLKHLETRPLTKASLQSTLMGNPLVTDEFITRWVDVQRAPGHRDILMATMGGAGGAADPAALATISVPTLIQWGEGDPLIGVFAARRFNEAIPGSRLIVYPGLGHMPHLESPEQTAADAHAFLREALAN